MEVSQRRGSGLPSSPSHTRSSEKYGRDLRSGDGNGFLNIKQDKEKGVNVQVILRCRPLSEEDARLRTPAVISCNEQRREVLASHNVANKQIDKAFVFDKVFGPTSLQKDLFDHCICPIVKEVLEGYNCTIFAYGQTGTGKTYTMEGAGNKSKNGDFGSEAGVIPRSVRRIFDTLEEQNMEYCMKVTFLELYNEEITDLLAPEESKSLDSKPRKPLALMEDGKGGVFVRGLEEEMVHSSSEIYRILDKGSAKRRTAETLLNKQSSRSHSIFSITIHVKEVTPGGEEVIKIGKLNLVDLAGSENISRSGAREGRAREAGEINKSLLTLGRVINALVEHSGHIPYRESKLTRLLRDSLGGKTKTCIIATISPSIHCLEETLSTLDYAYRAKNIKNKPEVNQKMMKSVMIKDLCSEIVRLKQEVYAAREKNGIYIPKERFQQEESQKKVMAEKMEQMELYLELKDKQLIEFQELYNSQQQMNAELSKKLDNVEKNLEDKQIMLLDLEARYRRAKGAIREKEYFISNLLHSEKSIVEHAHGLRSELENAAADISGLFSKIERKENTEVRNRILIHRFQSHLNQQLDMLHKSVSSAVMQQENQLKEMEDYMQSFISEKAGATDGLQGQVENLKALCGSGIRSLDSLAGELDQNSRLTFGKLYSQVLTHSSTVEDYFKGIAFKADNLLIELQGTLSNQEEQLNAFVQQQYEACAAKEEKQLLDKLMEMLASSNARKKKLFQTAVENLRASAADKTSNLQKEISNARDFSTSAKDEWMNYKEEVQNAYSDDISSVEAGRCRFEEGLKDCMEKAKMDSLQWEKAQDSLINLGKVNIESIESIVRTGMEANQLFRSKISATAATTLSDVDVTNNDLHYSLEYSLKMDHAACSNMDSIIAPSREDLSDLRSGHHHKIAEITDGTGKCLEEEYAVDEPSHSTPRRRLINLPSVASIEGLRTPAFEELLKGFWESKSAIKQINGDVRHLFTAYESPKDYRFPLTTLT
ncbi:125 kDa kinesin-related protein [Apostasia shenzhenica]|uniref:Kinesin-like protein n=1 Tax=Apostasia shenzhenica TaxID=1088818 RepID=A0A2H9ZSK2_9ASPA|nr:125 kDa kinesin-related protein [Apostasia shenzhenica]